MKPARQQHMAGLLAKERDGLRGLDGRSHHRPGRAVDAARQIDRNDRRRLRVHASIMARGRPSTGRSRPGAEQGVDDDLCARQGCRARAAADRTRPSLGSQRGVALEPG